jgi:hypothetical protein
MHVAPSLASMFWRVCSTDRILRTGQFAIVTESPAIENEASESVTQTLSTGPVEKPASSALPGTGGKVAANDLEPRTKPLS